jgi:hypothetical protein
MAETYIIFNSQGRRRSIEAESEGEARDQFRQFYPDEYSQGIIIRNQATGQESYTSPGYSTTDPGNIANIRAEGMTAGEASQRGWQEALVAEDPALARGAAMMSGVPFLRGWYDEAVGALAGPEAQAGVQAAEQAMIETRPMETLGLQLGTGIATSLPFGMASLPAAPMSLGRAAVQGGALGALTGATEGAVAGYGMGEEPIARSINAQQQAGLGAMFGGALGVAAPFAGAAVGGAVRGLFGNRPMQRIADALGLSPEATAQLGDVAAFEAGGPPITPSPQARSLAETSPEMRSLLDLAMSVPSEGRVAARGMLNEQALQASRNIMDDLDATLGQRVGPQIREAAMRQDTAAARRQAYDTAYAQPIDYSGTEGQRLLDLLDRVDPDILQRANRLMAREGNQSSQMRLTLDADGNITGVETLPDVMQIDYITRALQSRARTLGAEPEDVRTFTSQLTDIRGTLDDLVPEYQAARSEAAELLGNIEALDIGYGALRPGTTRDNLQMDLDGMTPGELANVQAGVRDYVDEVVGRVSRPLDPTSQEAAEAVAALRSLTTRNSQEKLRMIMGEAEADALIERLQDNIEPLAIRTVGGGSPTAPRQFAEQSLQENIQPGAIEQAAQNPQGIPGQLTGLLALGAPTAREAREAVLTEIAPFITRQRPADELAQLRQYLGQVGAAQELPQQLLRGGIRSGYLAGLGGIPTAQVQAERTGYAPSPVRQITPR